jgi:flagellar hook-associated protein 3 FlgL
MQGANGSLSASDRTALANEVADLKQELVGLANTKGSQGYLFGGSKTGSPPFAASGAFSGDDTAHVIQLGTGSPTPVSASGASAFTAAGGRNVFADLDALAGALSANDPSAVSGTLDNLEASRKQIVGEQAKAGLTMNKLDSSDAALEQLQLSLNKSTDQVAAADPYEAYSQMTTLAQSLERAVTVSRQILDLGSNNRF